MSKTESVEELAAARSKLVDAIDHLATMHRTFANYGALCARLQLNEGDWFCATRALESLYQLVNMHEDYALKENN